MTVTRDDAIDAGVERAELVGGLLALAAWLEAHPGSPIPDVHAGFRVPGERGEQLVLLDEIAEWLGVPVTDDGTGTLVASRFFGPVPAEAHVEADGRERRLAMLLPLDELAVTVRSWAGNFIPVDAA